MTKTKNQKKAIAKAKNNGGASGNRAKSSGKPQQGRVQTVYKNVQLIMTMHSFNFLRSMLFASSGPVRIPDSCQLTTSVVSASFDLTLTANANGCLGMVLKLNNYPRYNVESGASVDSAIGYNTVVLPNPALAMANSYNAVRVVSAEIHGFSTTASLSDQGQIMCYTLANNFVGSLEGVEPTNSAQLLSFRDNWTFSSKEGFFIRYKHTDFSSTLFTPTGTDINNTGFTRALLGFHGTGLSSNATYRVRYTVNYEALPIGDVLSYQNVETSKYDGPGYDTVKGILGAVPSFSNFVTVEKYLNQGLQTANTVAKAVEYARRLVTAYGARVI